jgi:hypothetical protein
VRNGLPDHGAPLFRGNVPRVRSTVTSDASDAESNANRFAERSRAAADAAIIHELLHSLGLGEDPPTSKQITDTVLARCAR